MEEYSKGCVQQSPTICFFMLLWLIICSPAAGETDPNDLNVLIEFSSGLQNAELLNWPTDSDKQRYDPCGPPSWPHVFCTGNRVSQIQVQNLGLNGILPQNFNQLTMLSNLGLQGNKFHSKLPSFKGLKELEFLYLNDNDFDTIPFDFFNGLGRLRVIALDHNPLNASVGWALPYELRKMVLLSSLSIVDCNLIGEVPEFLVELPSLSVLRLSYNRLSGSIPLTFAKSTIEVLWLNDQEGDRMSGSIDAVTAMKSMKQLWLHGNRFTGVIPEGIGELVSLKDLNLNRNQLVGTIPSSLADMELDMLKLDHNMLCGAVPKLKSHVATYEFNSFCQTDSEKQCGHEVVALLSFLEAVKYPNELASRWSGNDPCNPPWMGLSCNSESMVSVINLPGLELTGHISTSLAMLDSLVEIRLDKNRLSGSIPGKLTELKYLRLLDLSGNILEPPLPDFSSSVRVLIDGNPGFQSNQTHSSATPPQSSPQPANGTNSEEPTGAQKYPPPTRYGPSSSPATAVKTSSTRLKVIKISIIVAVVLISILAFAVLIMFHVRRKKKVILAVPSTVRAVNPTDRGAYNLESSVEISVASRGTDVSKAEQNKVGMENRPAPQEYHVINAGSVVISIQVLGARAETETT